MLLADIVLSMSNMVANTHQQREEKYTPVIGYAGFINWIKSQCQGMPSVVLPEHVFSELVSAKLVQESESGIAYHIKR